MAPLVVGARHEHETTPSGKAMFVACSSTVSSVAAKSHLFGTFLLVSFFRTGGQIVKPLVDK